MKGKIQIMGMMLLAMVVFVVVISALRYKDIPKHKRYVDHIENADADPSLGAQEIPDNKLINDSFISHLPLVIIDTNGKEIKNYKEYNTVTQTFDEPAGIDVYTNINISIIDNENHVNRITDNATIDTYARIKIRGNNSASPNKPKYQYRIKLTDETFKTYVPADVMGMGEEKDWILSPTVADKSFVRNYMAYNLAGMLSEYQSDIRFCEVIFKDKDKYTYNGLYMMVEPVEVSENRVNISANESKYDVGLGYLLKKDRLDPNAINLNTWLTQQDTEVGGKSFYEVLYPKEEDVTDTMIKEIEKEISYVEKGLYSDNIEMIEDAMEKIDVDTFVDYYIINEFFGNIDAANYSTYIYKDLRGKISIGPCWDYDGAMDNFREKVIDPEKFTMTDHDWFEALIKSKEFDEKVIKRYNELREGILSYEYIEKFTKDTRNYLGNALLRDQSCFGDYVYDLQIGEDEETGFSIDRKRYTSDAETQRVLDYIYIHGDFLDKNAEQLYGNAIYDMTVSDEGQLFMVGFLILFGVSIIVVQRYMSS